MSRPSYSQPTPEQVQRAWQRAMGINLPRNDPVSTLHDSDGASDAPAALRLANETLMIIFDSLLGSSMTARTPQQHRIVLVHRRWLSAAQQALIRQVRLRTRDSSHWKSFASTLHRLPHLCTALRSMAIDWKGTVRAQDISERAGQVKSWLEQCSAMVQLVMRGLSYDALASLAQQRGLNANASPSLHLSFGPFGFRGQSIDMAQALLRVLVDADSTAGLQELSVSFEAPSSPNHTSWIFEPKVKGDAAQRLMLPNLRLDTLASLSLRGMPKGFMAWLISCAPAITSLATEGDGEMLRRLSAGFLPSPQMPVSQWQWQASPHPNVARFEVIRLFDASSLVGINWSAFVSLQSLVLPARALQADGASSILDHLPTTLSNLTFFDSAGASMAMWAHETIKRFVRRLRRLGWLPHLEYFVYECTNLPQLVQSTQADVVEGRARMQEACEARGVRYEERSST